MGERAQIRVDGILGTNTFEDCVIELGDAIEIGEGTLEVIGCVFIDTTGGLAETDRG